MSSTTSQVYLVDDEPAVLKALSRLLRSAGFQVTAYSSAKDFIAQHHADTPGCLVLDLSMPDLGGLELQQWLAKTQNPLPVIFLTGHGDIPTSVRAIKAGAVDFLTKPVSVESLINVIHEALKRGHEARLKFDETKAFQDRLAILTPREREVFGHVVAGQLNKQIAAELGTVEQTIKVHRARVMAKMGVQSLAELVRIAERARISP